MQDKKATPERLTGVTERLCRTIAEIGSDSIPEEAVNVAKRVILDGIAVAIAGVHEEGPRIAADHIRSLGGTGDSVVLGMGFRANPVSAALVNGISIHILDFEPMWMPPTHAVSPSLPSVLAAAEMKKANGREVAAAFVKACEIQGRLNLAGKLLAPALLVHHPPGYLGVTRLLGTIDGLKKFVQMHESPYHGLNFCQGTTGRLRVDGRQRQLGVGQGFADGGSAEPCQEKRGV